MSERLSHLIASRATIATSDSGELGGVSAMDAMVRYISGNESYLVIPWADTDSSLVTLNYFGLSLNLLLNFVFGWNLYVAHPGLVRRKPAGVDGFDDADDFLFERSNGIYDLQWEEYPLLLSNVALPMSNSWYHYTRGVHFDEETAIAAMYMAPVDQSVGISQVEAAKGLLFHVAKVNSNNLCGPIPDQSLPFLINFTQPTGPCYVPVIFFDDSPAIFETFVDAMLTAPYAPALIVFPNGVIPGYESPVELPATNASMWVASYELTRESYQHLLLGIMGTSIHAISYFTWNQTNIPEEAKDDDFEFSEEILNIFLNITLEDRDPIVGRTGFMPPVVTLGEHLCFKGECAVGNLFADALRGSDLSSIAFLPSSLFRGPGWPAGDVDLSQLWDAFPVPSDACTGTMSGLSLFKLLDFSFRRASFDGVASPTAGDLLQVSGMQIEYNSRLQGPRILSIDIWDEDKQAYLPIERLKLYNFTTDSSVCSTFEQFAAFVGEENLVLEGERPGVIFEFDSVQQAARSYLNALDSPYNTSVPNRLRNTVSRSDFLNLVETPADCVPRESYWSESLFSCVRCPVYEDVFFSNRTAEFSGENAAVKKATGQVDIINNENYSVFVNPKTVSFPSWFSFTSDTVRTDGPTRLLGNETASLDLAVDTSILEPGTAVATVAFVVSDGGRHPGCVGGDLFLDLTARISPRNQDNNLGSVAIFGFVVAGVVVTTAAYFAAWVQWHKKLRVVTALQPAFLTVMCFGVVLLGLVAVPLSFDDGLVSVRGCDIACMSIPWLASNGFTVTTAALFSKLWRINKLFGLQRFRRMEVREKDVLVPFAVLFVFNLGFLIAWTVVDPLTWARNTIPNQPWNSYGLCALGGTVSIVMLSLVLFCNLLGFIAACYQAVKARNISSEFSESKYLGIAIFSWVQLLIVGLPVLFLISEQNVTARYSLVVALILAVCMSMLLVIFVPMLVVKAKGIAQPKLQVSGVSSSMSRTGTGAVHVSGLSGSRDDSASGSDPYGKPVSLSDEKRVFFSEPPAPIASSPEPSVTSELANGDEAPTENGGTREKGTADHEPGAPSDVAARDNDNSRSPVETETIQPDHGETNGSTKTLTEI